MLQILWKVCVALFSVFGFICAVSAFVEGIFTPRQLTVALRIFREEDAEELDLLLREAYCSSLRHRPARVVVLFSSSLLNGTVGSGGELNPEVTALLDEYGAEGYLIDE